MSHNQVRTSTTVLVYLALACWVVSVWGAVHAVAGGDSWLWLLLPVLSFIVIVKACHYIYVQEH